MEDDARKGKRGRTFAAGTALVVLLAVGAYAPSLGNGFLEIWDDPQYVTQNPNIRGLTLDNVEAAFTRSYVSNWAPLHVLSYALDYSLFGLDPFAFRLVNVLLHALSAVLVMMLVVRVSGDRTTAILSALVFALHPVQVESVAWVAERKNVLSTAFALGSMLSYLRFLDHGRWLPYAASILLFAAALLTKVAVVVLPVLLCLYVVLFDRPTVRRLAAIVPFFLLAAGVAFVAMRTQERVMVPYHGGSPLATAFTMAPVFVTYLQMFVFPVGLSPIYDPTIYSTFEWPVLASSAVLATLGSIVWFRRKDPQTVFWSAWTVICIAPVSQIVPIVTLMNDRYLYLPLIALAPLAVRLVGSLAGRRRVIVVAVLIALVLPLTCVRARLWDSGPALWEDALKKYPDETQIYVNLAEVHLSRGEGRKAGEIYLQAIAAKSDNLTARQGLAEQLLMKTRCYREARIELGKLYDLGVRNDRLVSNLGFACTDVGEVRAGLRYHQEVLSRNPRFWTSVYGVALAYKKLGDSANAAVYWRRFLEVAPPNNRWRARAQRELAATVPR